MLRNNEHQQEGVVVQYEGTARPVRITLIALFFAFGAAMSSLAAIMLLVPGSPLESLWRLNPAARASLGAMGLGSTPRGRRLYHVRCRRRRAMATAQMGAAHRCCDSHNHMIGDTANALLRYDFRTLVGLPIAAVMSWCLVTRRDVFT